jgi:hypothetical protein
VPSKPGGALSFPKWLRFAVSLRPRSSYLSASSPHRKILGFWYIVYCLGQGDQQLEKLLRVKSVHRHSHQELRHMGTYPAAAVRRTVGGHVDSTGCLWVLVNAKALGPQEGS